MTKCQEEAGVIRSQIGHKALCMLGSQFESCSVSKDGCSCFEFRPRGSKKANFVRVKLTPLDLYDVEFWKIRGLNVNHIETVPMVDAENLTETIGGFLELATTLGTMGAK